MNCSFCGRELRAGAKFCPFCGTRAPGEEPKNPVCTIVVPEETAEPVKKQKKKAVPEDDFIITETVTRPEKKSVEKENKKEKKKERVTDSVEETVAEPVTETAGETPKKKKGKKKLIIVLAAVVACLAVIFAAVSVMALGLFADKTAGAPIEAYTYSGGACLCYGDGKLMRIDGEIDSAYMTPDGKKVVYIEKTGAVRWTKTGKDGGAVIYNGTSEEEISIIGLCNEMVFFSAGECVCRYDFEESSFLRVDLTDVQDAAVSSSVYTSGEGGAFGYVKENAVWVLPSDENAARQIGSYPKTASVNLYDVSCDGEAVLWSVNDNGTLTLYLYTDGNTDILETVKAEEMAGKAVYSMTCPTESSELLVITSHSSGTVYIKKDEYAFEKFELADAVGVSAVYSADGMPLAACDEVDADEALYVGGVQENGLYSLYMVRSGGSSALLMNDIEEYKISGERILYISASGSAYAAEVNVKTLALKSNMKLAEKAYSVHGAIKGGRYAYVTVEMSEGMLDLYRYDIKAKAFQKIGTNVSSDIHVSEDGKKVYYYISVGENTEKGYTAGTLCVADKKGSTQISTNVIIGTLTSNLVTGEIDDDSIWFETYVSDTAESYLYNAVFCDGKTASPVVMRITK